MEMNIEERGEAVVDLNINVAAVATVAAIRASVRDILLPPETTAAFAARSRG
jgi:hypothetical protein